MVAKSSKPPGIRVRMAPSPTGFLHFGTARTALFTWLFAKSVNGAFILRIEDTDKGRNKPEFEADILFELKWLGLNYDEMYKQSERTEIYKDYLKRLIDENKAYYCFCSKEELEGERESLAAAGLPQKYSGRCRILTKDESLKKVINGEKYVIRFKVPEKEIVFADIIRGKSKFDMTLVGDIVIARDLDNPLYNFVVVVDDALMNITHVIRAEDHYSNTPKQILIYEAFGFTPPKFAHLPLVLNPDRSKMSKRFNDVSVKDYREQGYLKEAFINFIAFMGWHPREDKEIMSVDEIIKEFTLERIQKAGAVFNVQKLDWLNAYYINQLNIEDFIKLAKDYIPADWKITPPMALSIKTRMKKMSEAQDLLAPYFELPDYDASLLKWKEMTYQAVRLNLEKAAVIIKTIGESVFNKEAIEKILVQETASIPKGEIFWPLRVALAGQEFSPPPFEIIEILGRDESLKRIDTAIARINGKS